MGTICELAHITKKYDDHVVLDDFQLSIEEGDMVAIMGMCKILLDGAYEWKKMGRRSII
ncbi:hypothetical protein AB434_0168 [Heyndrickxia coagulans]|uniref:Uncharacterized protein n=1 Tax=Heyndrickxia coagulans TaxID=1398 RepID=A0AAN0WB00_HEYCO|nr:MULTISPECIES: hypothetical protein [Heyndrickxia]AJO21806.1 hypothetical protein SB48_HM08orf01555 [Heyndrickxia coagulans]AKN52573.1 hypothetical protein AB434_0168 [Heyndrickxia coagulans]MCU6436901.1 hypothetical protein [Heyndrickxia coagulans]QYF69669.1 hypothetical protein KZO26_13090 [Heyndrickxia coagulans]UYT04123.1 hypothetical protein OF158_13340 [Weizmannia sp. WK01]